MPSLRRTTSRDIPAKEISGSPGVFARNTSAVSLAAFMAVVMGCAVIPGAAAMLGCLGQVGLYYDSQCVREVTSTRGTGTPDWR